MKLFCSAVATLVVAISEISFGPVSLKALGTHNAKRCEGPASQGKRVHFREGRKNVLRSLQKIVLERLETRRAAVRPKQNKRRPQGGGPGPKQCPGAVRAGNRGSQIDDNRDQTAEMFSADHGWERHEIEEQLHPRGKKSCVLISISCEASGTDF